MWTATVEMGPGAGAGVGTAREEKGDPEAVPTVASEKPRVLTGEGQDRGEKGEVAANLGWEKE